MNTPKQNFIGIAGWLIRVLLILPNALLVETILLLAAVAAFFFFPRCASHICNAAQALPSFGWYFRNAGDVARPRGHGQESENNL